MLILHFDGILALKNVEDVREVLQHTEVLQRLQIGGGSQTTSDQSILYIFPRVGRNKPNEISHKVYSSHVYSSRDFLPST